MNYGYVMKSLRTYDLKTQKDMANILKIKEDTYSKYERQVKIIPLKHLNIFCNYFDVSIDYVLGFSEQKCYPTYSKDIDKHVIGKKLRDFRKKRNITQKDLATKLNYDRSSISKYEAGAILVSLDFLYKICSEYKVSADYLLGKIDESFIS